jgi:hypothetical protein
MDDHDREDDPKEVRRRQLIDLIEGAKADYFRAIDPWVQELAAIAMTDPPPPVVLPDGRVMKYIGPLPEWTPEGMTFTSGTAKRSAPPRR